ncbi:MAG: HDOD domain-containing protein [Desulfovibrionaceae bacterium]
MALTRRALRFNDLSHEIVRELSSLGQCAAFHISSETGTVQRDAMTPRESDPLGMIRTAISHVEFPAMYYQVSDAMTKRGGNASRVAEVIAQEPALAATLLRLVNSPFYGLNAPVESLQRAVAFAGFNEISALALSLSVQRFFKGMGMEAGQVDFWRRSIFCGVLAKRLARRTGLGGQWHFVAGLLYDMGGLLACRELPVRYAHLKQALRCSDAEPCLAETDQLGFATPQIGAVLLERWALPQGVTRLVGLRRTPARSGYEPGVCVLHLAEIVTAVVFAWNSGGQAVPVLDVRAWNNLRLTASELTTSATEAWEEAQGILETFIS